MDKSAINWQAEIPNVNTLVTHLRSRHHLLLTLEIPEPQWRPMVNIQGRKYYPPEFCLSVPIAELTHRSQAIDLIMVEETRMFRPSLGYSTYLMQRTPWMQLPKDTPDKFNHLYMIAALVFVVSNGAVLAIQQNTFAEPMVLHPVM